ncbi:MAG: DNA-binding protein WhiA [Clostridia bacterium]|nr:DNA-binding protein WhiA [Clostridia bacterium]
MSFSTDVKNELCSVSASRTVAEAECYGMLFGCRSFSFDKIFFQTGNRETAEHFINLLRHTFDITASVSSGGDKKPTYRVCIESDIDRKRIMYRLGYSVDSELVIKTDRFKAEGSVKAFVKGVFLAAGNVSDPEKEYRIDFSFKTSIDAEQFVNLLSSKGINLSICKRDSRYITYTKNSTTVEDLLTFMGAGTETLNLIGVKIYKNVRNKLNRQNNCETSNILKTANAAYIQTKAIEKLKNTGKLAALPEELVEVANLRLQNPEMSLSELSRLSKTKLTRSGINHRMKKLLEISDSIK